MGESHFHRRAMRLDEPLVSGNLGHDRDRLRRRQGDIPAWPVLDPALSRLTELLTSDPAFEQFGKLLAIDLT